MMKLSRNTLIVAAIMAGVFLGSVAILDHFYKPDRYISQPAPQLPSPPLKTLASRRGLQLGNFAALKYLRERPYRDILTSQFEYATIDGEPNWKFEDSQLRPSQDRFDFTSLDKAFAFAAQNNMPVRYQHLVWGDEKWLPDWLKSGKYTKEQLLEILHNHIATVGARYKGKVREYSVVNEAFSREILAFGNHDWWGERLGHDYIDKSFLWARAADPDAVLILNDFGNEADGEISKRMYDYVKDAKARGIPIDAIGMQMHIDAAHPPSKSAVVANMRHFASLGIKVYVTEFDVTVHDVSGTVAQQDEAQAAVYRDMLGACLEVGPGACPNFGFLGLTDRQSWYNGIGIHDARPLMFRDDYTPKPAFYGVRGVLGGE